MVNWWELCDDDALNLAREVSLLARAARCPWYFLLFLVYLSYFHRHGDDSTRQPKTVLEQRIESMKNVS